MSKIIDVHHHIKLKTPITSIYNCYKPTCLDDLDRVENELKNIGIHPDYIKDEIDFNKYEEVLLKNPLINIGEIGLDKNFNNVERQSVVFDTFLKLAVNYNRSISIHCIKKWGLLLKSLNLHFNKQLPCLLHGYSGSLETLKELLKFNSFFSLSLRELRIDRLIPVIKSIPIEKLLIESDMSNSEFLIIGDDGYMNLINSIYEQVSIIKKIPKIELIRQIDTNFHSFTNR